MNFIRKALLAAILGGFFMPASAQHNHHMGHNDYQGWASQLVGNCCDNRDCGSLKEDEHRETATGPEILIDGQWCPVLKQHYLTRGRSPDWSVAHACIRLPSPYWSGCERLLCYSPKGGF